MQASKDLEMSEGDFQKISALVYDLSGIHLHDGKKELVKARLGKRMRSGSFQSFREYYQHVLEDNTGRELVDLLDAVSTNFTGFFREPKHFEFLKSEFLPRVTEKKKSRKLRFWSAGCSSGEEPYSIAMTLEEALDRPESWDAKVTATDLSTRMLSIAASGTYSRERVRTMAPELLKRHFLKGVGSRDGQVQVKPRIRQYVSFQRVN
ncbi:MAG TPA: protein-glutamate O-methyltransferase CheR, partial [Thermodesulfobacteriota bacterium]|nr:protein-glutamate O-methyltransferase CheR [Thermodesulfobacteriota bacterium]